jgi:hypothetical protein
MSRTREEIEREISGYKGHIEANKRINESHERVLAALEMELSDIEAKQKKPREWVARGFSRRGVRVDIGERIVQYCGADYFAKPLAEFVAGVLNKLQSKLPATGWIGMPGTSKLHDALRTLNEKEKS